MMSLLFNHMPKSGVSNISGKKWKVIKIDNHAGSPKKEWC